LHAVITYLPRYLVDDQLEQGVPGQTSGQFRPATIMFADISGFTALSERLSRRGQQGAEAITRIVDDCFTAMLDVTERHGGDLLKFGGDALLVAFMDDSASRRKDAAYALAACQAATEMQQTMARFGHIGALGETFGLKMTVGLGSGSVFTASLGTPSKMEHTVMGTVLAEVAFAEDQAVAGEIYIDQATFQSAGGRVAVDRTLPGRVPGTHCYRLAGARAGEDTIHRPAASTRPTRTRIESMDSAREQIARLTTNLDVLVPYLPPGLLDMLCFDPQLVADRGRGEFRPVTTVFCNFYGTQEIIERLGPSRRTEITAILNAHFSQMQQIIDRYGGVIDKVDSYVVGHRIMALFGAPRAHVDDPERAVRAAWEMQAAMGAFRELKTSAGTFALKQRIGINTGRVFAGNIGSTSRREYTVMGDEVNLTARLMSLASEGQIRISQSTAAQISTNIELNEQSPVQVKGKRQPVASYELLGLGPTRANARVARQTPLVGRDAEWSKMWQVVQQACTGRRAQLLDIHGEIGMGKSRLLQKLQEQWIAKCGKAYTSACVAYGRHIPYAPWQDLLEALLRPNAKGREDSANTSHDDWFQEDNLTQAHIMRRLAPIRPEWTDGLDPVDWTPLVSQILGLPTPASALLQSLDPELRQQNLQRILYGLLLSEASQQPTLLVIDDLQWIDQASLALLNALVARLGTTDAQLLICVAHRPLEIEDAASQTAQAYQAHTECQPCTTVHLQPLSEEASSQLLESQIPTLSGEAVNQARWQQLKALILKNAQGNPLFIVEMAHALLESTMSFDPQTGSYYARADIDQVHVPDTISRVILSRLDRLDEQSRNVLRVASVIGHEFQQWLLQEVYPYPMLGPELSRCLIDLCTKELLDRSQLLYLFRHVMTRQVAYESLLYAERQRLHRQIAECIEAQHSQAGTNLAQAEDQQHPSAEVLAHHFTLAEDWPKALHYQMMAGRRAQAIFANEDVLHRYRQALDIAERVPESQFLQQQAHAALSDTLATMGDYDSALTHMDQAIHLTEALKTSPTETARCLADLFCRTAAIYEKKSDYSTAFDWLRGGLLALEGAQVIEAAHIYSMGAGIYHRQGDNAQALQWCESSLKLATHLSTSPAADDAARKEAQEALAHIYYLQGAIYIRYGEHNRAVDVCQKSLGLYEHLENLPGAGAAHNNLASAFFDLGDWALAAEHYDQALHIATQIGNVHESGLIANNLGEVYRYRGDLKQAQMHYQQSLQTWHTLGSLYGEAFLLMNLGAVELKQGQWAKAIELLEDSQRLSRRIDAEDFGAEAYRYLAEAHLGRGQELGQAGHDEIAKGLQYAQQSLQLAERQEMRLEEGATHRVLGRIHRVRGDLQAAEQELDRSLDILESLGSQYQIGQTLMDLAKLYQEQDRLQDFRQSVERAVTLFERLGAKLDQERARQLG